MRNTTRNHTFDALRTLVILLMTGSHTTRMIADESWIFWNKFVLLIEPFTAASFLFLVGSSLVLSWKRATENNAMKPRGWICKKLKRCILLWIVSLCMYFASVGLVWPDSFVLSGILATIAYSTVVFGLLMILPQRIFAIIIVTTAATVLYLFLDMFSKPIYFLTHGNSPLLPLTIFTGLGALFTLWLPSPHGNVKKSLIALCLFSIALPLLLCGPEKVFTYPLGRYKIKRQAEVLLSVSMPLGNSSATVVKTIRYYNLRPVLIPVITAMIVLFYFIITRLSHLLAGKTALKNILKKILALGRHSLDIYILHLVLLALFIGKKASITVIWQGTLLLLVILLICFAYVISREYIARKKSIDHNGSLRHAVNDFHLS